MAKIMLVEDDATMLSLLRTLLEMEGFEVIAGPDEAEALLEALRTHHPDLLVMDVHLAGGVSGIDLLQSIRGDTTLQGIRVVMTSGIDYSHASLEAGADGFLQKPYMVNDLLEVIRRTLA